MAKATVLLDLHLHLAPHLPTVCLDDGKRKVVMTYRLDIGTADELRDITNIFAIQFRGSLEEEWECLFERIMKSERPMFVSGVRW